MVIFDDFSRSFGIHSGNTRDGGDYIPVCCGNVYYDLVFQQVVTIVRSYFRQLVFICLCSIDQDLSGLGIRDKRGCFCFIGCFSGHIIHAIFGF